MVLLFKKGDATLPQNYRPISLLAVGYKTLASLIHHRLLQGGTEERMHSSQYGFRHGRGTADALMVVRRMVDAAVQRNKEGLLLVLLDWAKAFDRMKTDSMLSALRRFGLPEEFVSMVNGIYQARLFVIRDHTGTSSERSQECGIAQGCPLSPYLFIMVQTVMLHDVYATTVLDIEPDFIVTHDVLYADDTLLASSSAANMQRLVNAVVQEGAPYGLEINWSKTIQIQVSTQQHIGRPDGGPIACVREGIYLGGMLTCDGKARRELVRRLGEGRRAFDGLCKVWSHAGISRARKLHIYMTCVASKVLYSMESLWLLKADRTKLDAFHYRCLRKVLGIPCSYLSRVPNWEVLERAGVCALSKLLLDRQTKLYTRLALQRDDSFARKLICFENGQPRTWYTKRGRGRPRQTWACMVHGLLA